MIGDLVAHLKNSEAIANLIGNRIYISYAPPGTPYPYVVVDVTGNVPADYHLNGEIDLSRSSIQVDCWGVDSDESDGFFEANRLAAAIRNRISGYRGLLNDSTQARNIDLQSEMPMDEKPKDGSSSWRRRVTQQYEVLYETTVPDFT